MIPRAHQQLEPCNSSERWKCCFYLNKKEKSFRVFGTRKSAHESSRKLIKSSTDYAGTGRKNPVLFVSAETDRIRIG